MLQLKLAGLLVSNNPAVRASSATKRHKWVNLVPSRMKSSPGVHVSAPRCGVQMELGRISAIFRYPVKSMAGELLDVARLSWHGIDGDRRFAFRRLNDKSGFPWLTASKLPQLLLYKPFRIDNNTGELLPTHVGTPDGKEYELRSNELREEIASRYGSDVELMNLKHGIFDEACISVISLGTVHCVERESGRDVDLRRFRANVVIETNRAEPFEEDRWVGRTLMFGENSGAAVRVTMRDERCVRLIFTPIQRSEILK